MKKVPVPDDSDKVHALTRTALAAIPGIGGSSAQIFTLVVTPSLEKRRTKWLEELAQAVDELGAKVDALNPEKLVGDERFVSALLQATSAAMRTHEQSKLDALRNAVINTALQPGTDEIMSTMFLSLVDQLTPTHLRVLAYFEDPAKWARDHGHPFPDGWQMGPPTQPLLHALPELTRHDKIYVSIIQDLNAKGLIEMSPNSLSTNMNANSAQRSATTALGKGFLAFISAPQLDEVQSREKP